MSPPSSMGTSGRRRHSMQRIKAKEDDLMLFRDMLTKEKDEFLLCSADELEDSLSKFKYFPDFKSNVAVHEARSDLLSSDYEKNDYEWLITPPETPLFPFLDDENPKTRNQTTTRRNSSQPKRLSTSKPRSSTPPIKRSSSVSARNPSGGNSPSKKFHTSQTKFVSEFHSFSDRPPSRARGSSPVPRRNSISPVASIVSFKEDIERKSENFSSFGNFQDVYHGNSEEIFRIIMSKIPGRTKSEEKRSIDAHLSLSSTNSSTIAFSDGSSSVTDDRSEKMLGIDRHQGIIPDDKMETVAVNEAEETYIEKEHEQLNIACLEFSDFCPPENSQKFETADKDVDFVQIREEKVESMARDSRRRSDAEANFTELPINDEVIVYPLLHNECRIDNFATFSRTGSRHRRAHSFSSYQNARSDNSQGVSVLRRSNSHRRPRAADTTLIVKHSSRTVDLTLSVDSSSSCIDGSMNCGEAELLSSKPQETLISSSVETGTETETHLVNSLDDEQRSNPINPEDTSQDSFPEEAKNVSFGNGDVDNFVAQPIIMETSAIVLLGQTKGDSENETKCPTQEEATDTVLGEGLATLSSSISMERENAQPLTVDHPPTKSTLEEKSTKELNREAQKISTLTADTPRRGVSKKPLGGQSPQMCSCSVM